MTDAFGWVTENNGGSLMLPAFNTRIEAIHYAMSVIDGPWPPEPSLKRLSSTQAARWRQIKNTYGITAIRVRIIPAFQEPTP